MNLNQELKFNLFYIGKVDHNLILSKTEIYIILFR